MWMFEGRNGNKLYKRILGSILAEGSEVSPRGLKTREFCINLEVGHKGFSVFGSRHDHA